MEETVLKDDLIELFRAQSLSRIYRTRAMRRYIGRKQGNAKKNDRRTDDRNWISRLHVE
jgi:hypothetical protein